MVCYLWAISTEKIFRSIGTLLTVMYFSITTSAQRIRVVLQTVCFRLVACRGLIKIEFQQMDLAIYLQFLIALKNGASPGNTTLKTMTLRLIIAVWRNWNIY